MSEETFPLSYSSGTLIKNCQQKYYYYKVAGVAKDEDSAQDETAFNVGKAFHYVMEMNNHSEDQLDHWIDIACKSFEVEDKKAMINAMLLRYLQVHKKSGLETVFCEFEIKTDDFIGYVDAVMKEPDDGWWLTDLKTASRFSEIHQARLTRDPQLNLYGYFAKDIANYLELDPEKFRGARYRTTTKSTLKKKVRESYREYVLRMAESIKSYDIVIPKELMSPEEIMKDHLELKVLADKFRSGEAEPKRNRSYCDSFFRSCEYWSQCYGCEFTEAKEKLEIITSNNV